MRILDRDLKLAGIAKRDERGRTLDVHALRHTFGTMLSLSSVTPRTAQAAMRHSTIDLTMNVYTDPKLLDVHGAVESLPSLSPADSQNVMTATGTDNRRASSVAPTVALTTDFSCNSLPTADTPASTRQPASAMTNLDATALGVNEKGSLTTGVNEPDEIGATRRLLNFFWPVSGAGKTGCGGRWTAESQRWNNWKLRPARAAICEVI